MTEFLNEQIANIIFIFERLTWTSVLDILLVTAIFFVILSLLRTTQTMVILRGALLLLALIGAISTLNLLPAFSWLVRTALPALLVAVPVIFAPEIRRALERLGRAGLFRNADTVTTAAQGMVNAIVTASARLSDRKHGALIVIQRLDSLEEYAETGVRMDARVSPELLLQIFYPNTPLHDGAVLISNNRIISAASVLPLSASGVLVRSPERQMGLRHRAALGISEASDAVGVVVSEETGSISVVHAGRMIRRLDSERLENILNAFFRSSESGNTFFNFLRRFFPGLRSRSEEI
ncbi:MAG TPA: diadenylate cyclase CdaA [Anaerolineales bacterium]|nr:diadenylate cyclase CdaA [Anaerolineales bacterium]